MANKPEIKKKERMVEKKRKRENNNPKPLSEKKEKCQRATRQRLDTRNPCTGYNPFSRQQHDRATDDHELPHTKKEWAVLVNIETTPPPPPPPPPHTHTHPINERYNSRNKRASQKKKTVNGKNRQLAQPCQTLTQGGHEIASLLN